MSGEAATEYSSVSDDDDPWRGSSAWGTASSWNQIDHTTLDPRLSRSALAAAAFAIFGPLLLIGAETRDLGFPILIAVACVACGLLADVLGRRGLVEISGSRVHIRGRHLAIGSRALGGLGIIAVVLTFALGDGIHGSNNADRTGVELCDLEHRSVEAAIARFVSEFQIPPPAEQSLVPRYLGRLSSNFELAEDRRHSVPAAGSRCET